MLELLVTPQCFAPLLVGLHVKGSKALKLSQSVRGQPGRTWVWAETAFPLGMGQECLASPVLSLVSPCRQQGKFAKMRGKCDHVEWRQNVTSVSAGPQMTQRGPKVKIEKAFL